MLVTNIPVQMLHKYRRVMGIDAKLCCYRHDIERVYDCRSEGRGYA